MICVNTVLKSLKYIDVYSIVSIHWLFLFFNDAAALHTEIAAHLLQICTCVNFIIHPNSFQSIKNIFKTKIHQKTICQRTEPFEAVVVNIVWNVSFWPCANQCAAISNVCANAVYLLYFGFTINKHQTTTKQLNMSRIIASHIIIVVMWRVFNLHIAPQILHNWHVQQFSCAKPDLIF